MILTVGRFSYMKGYGKGFDVLMNAMTSCPKDCSLYIVWDEPTPEFVDLKKKLKLDNVFFVGFKTKEELKDYYPEFFPFAGECRFDGCLHDREPQCRVKQAVAEGEVSAARYARYQKLLQELTERRENRYV